MILKRLFKNSRGAALVEYGLLIAGVALISSAAVSVFGHKTSDIIGAVTTILPGAHTDDNSAIISGKLIETAAGQVGANSGTGISLDVATIAAGSNTDRLGTNIGGATLGAVGSGTNPAGSLDSLIIEAH